MVDLAAAAQPAAQPAAQGATAEPELAALPILDITPLLANPDNAAALQTLAAAARDACTTTGFFMVRGHPPAMQAMIDALLARHAPTFFALPTETKRLCKLGRNRGYFAIGEENLDPVAQPDAGDPKEGLDLGPNDGREVELSERARAFRAPNVWPAAGLPDGFRAACMAYIEEATKVALVVLNILAVAMDEPRDFFASRMAHGPMSQLRLLRYPRTLAGGTACGAHSDYGCLTLLAVDGPGLEIYVPSGKGESGAPPKPGPQAHPGSLKHAPTRGEWRRVPFVPGVLVCNIGDMTSRWTNKTFKSTLHRVILPPGNHDRYSVPFFFDVEFDTKISPLPQFLPDGAMATETIDHFPGEPIIVGEHLEYMYNTTY